MIFNSCSRIWFDFRIFILNVSEWFDRPTVSTKEMKHWAALTSQSIELSVSRGGCSIDKECSNAAKWFFIHMLVKCLTTQSILANSRCTGTFFAAKQSILANSRCTETFFAAKQFDTLAEVLWLLRSIHQTFQSLRRLYSSLTDRDQQHAHPFLTPLWQLLIQILTGADRSEIEVTVCKRSLKRRHLLYTTKICAMHKK